VENSLKKNKNRASEVYAKTVFEKLLPDSTVRFFCANIIRDSIQIAHSIVPSCWKSNFSVGLILYLDSVFDASIPLPLELQICWLNNTALPV
jgi:hypothetical protein